MRSQLPRIAAVVLGCALLAAPPVTAGGADPADSERRREPQTSDAQTSDGVTGEIAAPMPRFLRGVATTTVDAEWRVAPGVEYVRWTQTDARGPIRAHLLTIDLSTPGLTLDYGSPGRVHLTDEVSDILARPRPGPTAIAGVNGDFFDIGDTGAPLGLGQDRQAGFLHAPSAGWNTAFFLDAKGRPDIGYLPLRMEVRKRPDLTITNVNSPEVRPGGIGIYTRRWGRTAGYRVTDGHRRQVRMVRVVAGRVVEIRKRLTLDQPIEGFLMIGRGKGARRLTVLEKGDRVKLRGRLGGRPTMAITGNKFLILDGAIRVVDDRELHPRTAIGIDRDTGEVLMLLIDGRQSFSRGYTMVELAEMMQDLGADEALNLDGGGSSTMVARRPGSGIDVVNSPSDGVERLVANAIEVTYRAPR